MNVKFYNNKSDKRALNKNLTEIHTCTATAKGDIDIISPEIIVKFFDITNCNFCYISEFKRYYFIEKIIYLTGQRILVTLKVDVLTSFSDDIKRLKVNVLRYENTKPTYIADSRIPLFSNTKQYVITFPDNIFNLTNPKETDKNFLLNIAGGE